MPAPKPPRLKSRRCKDLLVLNPRRPSLKRAGSAGLKSAIALLPELSGEPITVDLLPELSVSAGKLLSRGSGGKAVYAASFIRERRIVLDLALLQTSDLFRAILLHELFHFVWVRLGNPLRASFSKMLAQERDACACGNLGESSSLAAVSAEASVFPGSPQWRPLRVRKFLRHRSVRVLRFGSWPGA